MEDSHCTDGAVVDKHGFSALPSRHAGHGEPGPDNVIFRSDQSCQLTGIYRRTSTTRRGDKVGRLVDNRIERQLHQAGQLKRRLPMAEVKVRQQTTKFLPPICGAIETLLSVSR